MEVRKRKLCAKLREEESSRRNQGIGLGELRIKQREEECDRGKECQPDFGYIKQG